MADYMQEKLLKIANLSTKNWEVTKRNKTGGKRNGHKDY